MLEWDTDDFIRMVRRNGYQLLKKRGKGVHSIYQNSLGEHISIPLKVKAVIARRLRKEHNLDVDL